MDNPVVKRKSVPMKSTGTDRKKTEHVCWRLLVVVALSLPIVACGHWRDNFLEDSVGNATQADVKEKLGKPHRTKDYLVSGESDWVYRFVLTDDEVDKVGRVGRGINELAEGAAALIGKGPPPDDAVAKVHCFRYELRFNRKKILERWKKEKC